ncbi:MAG TPA: GGDEF domain-containing protein [Thermoanaerobaculia bacterium]
MRIESIEQVVASDVHNRLLRFLFAAFEGIDEQYLTSEEREAAAELIALSLAERRGGKLEPNLANPDSIRLMSSYGIPLPSTPSSVKHDPAEFERLYAEHREMIQLVGFIHDLTSTIMKTSSIANLFHAAFKHLARTVSFDVAVGVTLEQNIDVYLSRRSASRVDDATLIPRIRETLQKQMTVSFTSTDVIIRADLHDLGTLEPIGDPLGHETHVTLNQENRIAGTLILYRGTSEFGFEDNRYLDILSTQVSMVLGNIRAQEKIQSLADTDELTGVWNKRHLKRTLAIEIERARTYVVPLSLLMFDVDDFKAINDRYGHSMGDVVLSELCGTVRETLRPPDLFARYGGDEFIVILPHTDLWGARSAGDRILQKVRTLDLFAPDDDGLRITPSISIGIATYVPPDMTANDLVERADQRLYDSKRSGKNRYSW